MEESKNNKKKIDFSKEIASIECEPSIVNRSRSRECEELEEARRVIDFYADKKSWCSYGDDWWTSIACDIDEIKDDDGCDVFVGGQRARGHKKKWGF